MRALGRSKQEREEKFKNNLIVCILFSFYLSKAVFFLRKEKKKITNLVPAIGSINSCGTKEMGQNMLKRQML